MHSVTIEEDDFALLRPSHNHATTQKGPYYSKQFPYHRWIEEEHEPEMQEPKCLELLCSRYIHIFIWIGWGLQFHHHHMRTIHPACKSLCLGPGDFYHKIEDRKSIYMLDLASGELAKSTKQSDLEAILFNIYREKSILYLWDQIPAGLKLVVLPYNFIINNNKSSTTSFNKFCGTHLHRFPRPQELHAWR